MGQFFLDRDKIPIQNRLVYSPEGLITPNSELFKFGWDQVSEPLPQFPFKQILAKADFLQNGLYIF